VHDETPMVSMGH